MINTDTYTFVFECREIKQLREIGKARIAAKYTDPRDKLRLKIIYVTSA